MPDLTVTLTPDQVIRVQTALTPRNNGQPVTPAVVEGWLRQQLKKLVEGEEQRVRTRVVFTAVNDDLTREGW